MASADAKRREERVKLFATALSNLGVASVVTGAIAPALTGRTNGAELAVAFVGGLVLHLAGQGVLHLVVRDTEEV